MQYLHDYTSHFDLHSHIHLETKVTHLERDDQAEYPHVASITHLPSGTTHTIRAKKVVITTGLHVLPNIPSIDGLTANVASGGKGPKWIHSSSYKSRDQLRGKKVLVLGCGETGMDVAYESVLAPAEKVWMGIRTGFLSFPKVLNNFRVFGATFDGALPIDGLITNLFETA